MEEEIKKEVGEVKENPKLVESAYEAASKLREENERMEKNISRLEELKAFETLGGKSEGAPQEEKPKEETPEEYAKRVMSGVV